MSALTNRVRRQFTAFDLSFLTESTLLTIGITIARVLGFGFSLVLARKLAPDDFGYVQYTLTLAGVIAIGTQPFVQHVMARFVGKYHADDERLQQTLHAIWWTLLGITTLTLVISVPVLILTDRFSISVLVIFAGFTLFYGYYGLARGFLASKRLLIAYLGSNIVQILAILLFYEIGDVRSSTPALLIYGLSYLLPIILLQVVQPLPLYFRFSLPDKTILRELLRFSLPVWISHAAYIFYSGMDVLLLERYMDSSTVGVYVLTKTLTMLFSFVPVGLITVLLPKVAALPTHKHFALLKKSLIAVLLMNGAALIVFALCYQWFVGTFINPDYVVPMDIMLMMALSEVLFGFHGIITAVVVGGNNPQLETVSRIIIVITALVVGMILIPSLGLRGAALMKLACGMVSLVTYLTAAVIRRRQRVRNVHA
ncbi:MAG: oligosaccharide flippase family protein [Anaerolineae bacterium]